MIEQVTHTEPGADPAAIGLALAVASALHAPIGRAPEMAPTAPTRRTSRPARTRRRTARG
ncbi:hypothetical protein ACF09Y_17450 [Streptomyces massasporeus]|uniref:hypothetical protein n=1 Tax=Streptomyces massasporeus TaxID=67324 RepID=UPI0036F8420A